MVGGATAHKVAQQFGVSVHAVYRHRAHRHISEAFTRSVSLGPLKNELQLRNLCAEAGTSVIDNLRAIYSGLAARWLANFEAGADNA